MYSVRAISARSPCVLFPIILIEKTLPKTLKIIGSFPLKLSTNFSKNLSNDDIIKNSFKILAKAEPRQRRGEAIQLSGTQKSHSENWRGRWDLNPRSPS